MNEHYKQHDIEAIDVIRAWNLGFELGNAIKYIARHNHKGDPVLDLEKAIWYLRSYIDNYDLERKYSDTVTGVTHL